MGKKRTPSDGLRMANSVLLALGPEGVSKGIGTFLSQPLPILVRYDLKLAADAILAQSKVVNELHVELLKQHGAKEMAQGILVLKHDHPNYPAFAEDFRKLGEKTFALPLKAKIALPAKVTSQAKENDLVMDGAGFVLWESIVEVVR